MDEGAHFGEGYDGDTVETREEDDEENSEEEDNVEEIRQEEQYSSINNTLRNIAETLENQRIIKKLTKYEKASVIGIRAQQIALSSPIFLSKQDINLYNCRVF